jgi:DNA-binding GntR family transcriptional regulator
LGANSTLDIESLEKSQLTMFPEPESSANRDRMTRYYPLFHNLFPDPATRPRQQEVLIECLRKGEVDEAVRAFKKNYLEVVHRMIHHLETGESANISR